MTTAFDLLAGHLLAVLSSAAVLAMANTNPVTDTECAGYPGAHSVTNIGCVAVTAFVAFRQLPKWHLNS